MSENMKKVEVYQPRDPGQFYDEENDEWTDNLAHDIRDARGGFVDAENIDLEFFGSVYSLVGAEEIEAETDAEALSTVWRTWQNNDGATPTSEVFRAQNDRRIATSLSAGNILRVDGTAYLCDRLGWSAIDQL